MTLKFRINTRPSSEKMEDTFDNIVVKFDSASTRRIQDLNLDDAREKYLQLLKNLTIAST